MASGSIPIYGHRPGGRDVVAHIGGVNAELAFSAADRPKIAALFQS